MKRPCLPLPAVRTDWTTNILTPENYPLYGIQYSNYNSWSLHCVWEKIGHWTICIIINSLANVIFSIDHSALIQCSKERVEYTQIKFKRIAHLVVIPSPTDEPGCSETSSNVSGKSGEEWNHHTHTKQVLQCVKRKIDTNTWLYMNKNCMLLLVVSTEFMVPNLYTHPLLLYHTYSI